MVVVTVAGKDDHATSVKVELADGGVPWTTEVLATLATAGGVDTVDELHLRYSDGSIEPLSLDKRGWRTVRGMEEGDVLLVFGPPKAAAAEPAAAPTREATRFPLPAPPGVFPPSTEPGPPELLPPEEQNSKRLHALFLSGSCAVRSAFQQVCW